MILIFIYTLFQNGAHEHESEAKGARFCIIIIDYTTRKRFSYILARFFFDFAISFVYGQFEAAEDEIYGKIRALRRPAVP